MRGKIFLGDTSRTISSSSYDSKLSYQMQPTVNVQKQSQFYNAMQQESDEDDEDYSDNSTPPSYKNKLGNYA